MQIEATPLPRYEYILAVLVLFGAAFLLYAGSFGHAWTYDDFPVLVNNPDIRSLTNFFEDRYAVRPLRELTYLIDYALFGLKPAGYHVQNIFWHGLSGLLLFLLVLRLGGQRFVAWGTALVFIAHPVLVEVVANISHRKDSLALAFALAATLVFHQSFQSNQRNRRILWLGLSILLALLAYAAKENAIALVPLAFAFEWAFVTKERRLLTRFPSVVFLLALMGVAYGGYWYLSGGRDAYLRGALFLFSKMSYYGLVNEWSYGLMLLKSWAFMFVKTLVPVNLAVEYTYPTPTSLLDPWVLAGMGLLLAGCLGLWFCWRRAPLLFFFLAWIGAFWIPVSNVWPLAYFAADRYLYAPMAGVAVLFCSALPVVLSRSRPLRWWALCLCVIALAALTWHQNRVWHDESTLWSHAVEVSPESVYALNNLGVLYNRRGDVPTALKLIGKAAENPFYQNAQSNMASLYDYLGQKERAAFYRQRAKNPHANR